MVELYCCTVSGFVIIPIYFGFSVWSIKIIYGFWWIMHCSQYIVHIYFSLYFIARSHFNRPILSIFIPLYLQIIFPFVHISALKYFPISVVLSWLKHYFIYIIHFFLSGCRLIYALQMLNCIMYIETESVNTCTYYTYIYCGMILYSHYLI